MKRPGKAVFDAGMMAGWAFVAVLTCLLALTVIDESTDPSQRSDVVVAVGSDDARLITGSVDPDEPGTASIRPDQNRALLDSQKQSFDPFAGNDEQQAQMRQLLKELRSLQREVEAFHVSTTRLRQENDQLRLLLQNLELADSRTAQTPSDAGAGSNKRKDGELIILSKENLQTKKKIRVVGPGAGNPFMNLEPADRSDKSVSLEPRVTDKVVDPIATGSIPAPENPQTISSNRNEFDPFEATNQSNVKLTVKPLDMDVAIQTEDGKMLLPRSKPVPIDLADDGRALKPQSEIVAAPGEISRTNSDRIWIGFGPVPLACRAYVRLEGCVRYPKRSRRRSLSPHLRLTKRGQAAPYQPSCRTYSECSPSRCAVREFASERVWLSRNQLSGTGPCAAIARNSPLSPFDGCCPPHFAV